MCVEHNKINKFTRETVYLHAGIVEAASKLQKGVKRSPWRDCASQLTV